MKLSVLYEDLKSSYPKSLKIIQKWAFCIFINSEGFALSKRYNLKLTKLDRDSIKAWVPITALDKWLNIFIKDELSFVLIWKEKEIVRYQKWKYILDVFHINIEDYNLTKERILWLNKLSLEEKSISNFLLEQKLQDLYILSLDLLLRLPKKQRYFFREKIERLFFDTFEIVFKYKYNLWERNIFITEIFNNTLLLKEFFRMFYNTWKIKWDIFYLDIWEKFVEILKICKSIKNKG